MDETWAKLTEHFVKCALNLIGEVRSVMFWRLANFVNGIMMHGLFRLIIKKTGKARFIAAKVEQQAIVFLNNFNVRDSLSLV